MSQPHLRSIAITAPSQRIWQSRDFRVSTANLWGKQAQVSLGALAPALGTWQGQKDWDGEPVGAGSKAMFFLASLPEFFELLWCVQSAEEHLEKQVDK